MSRRYLSDGGFTMRERVMRRVEGPWFRRGIAIGVLTAGAAMAAPSALLAGPPAEPADARPVTFAKDVAPIFQQKCQDCHRPGNIAPMSLVTYEEARPWARSIKARVAAREMPPWHLDKTVGIQEFMNDVSLSDREIETIVRWVDGGAPLGDPKDMPRPRQWPTDNRFRLEDRLGPPDMIVQSKPWTMAPVAQDVHFRPVVELGLTEPRWIRAVETRPSLKGRRIAHHVSTYLHRVERPEGAASGGVDDPAGELREMFTEWAQGKGGEIYPPNTGKLVKPGDKIEFETHYHAVGEEITDVIETAWWFYPKDVTPKFSAEFVPIGTSIGQGLEIPPNTITQHQGSYTLSAPAILHNFQPHMHMRGKAFLMEAIYPNGRREVINYADRYDNRWHINYIYAENAAPVFPKGTVLQITAWHDNTAANRNNPDPRQWVTKGGRTVDEMAHANTQLIYITEEEYQRILEQRKKQSAN
jgi:mono/diheme cytochrome c family protein